MMLADKVIVVTGAAGTLGKAVATVLVEHGATVAAIDYAADAPPIPAERLLFFGGVDSAASESLVPVMERISSQAGRIDGLVNCAGGFRWERIAGGSLETWDELYRLNLRTAVASCAAVLPHLVKTGSGSIVNVGAIGAVKASAGMAAYAASKAGVIALTQSLADELKDRGISVNAVLPSILDTARNRADMPDADFRKWVDPRAAAQIIAFLLTDAARAVTGAQIPIPGRL